MEERERRRVEIAKIKIAQKRLGLDDETYRAILERVTGKRSAADLDQGERGRVLDDLKRLGFRDSRLPERDPARLPAGLQIGKIRALWKVLVDMGAQADGSDAALRKFVKRQTGRDALEWLTGADAAKVIEGLKARIRRAVQGAAEVAEDGQPV